MSPATAEARVSSNKDIGCPTSYMPAADTIEGAAAIAVYIGKTVRQTNHLLETKQLPAYKLGGKWHLRRSTYEAFVDRLEADA